MKKCSRCNEVKDFSEFGKVKNHSSGYRSQCNPCRKIARKGYSEGDIGSERLRGYQLMTKYKITIAEYNKMLAEQGGKCMICNVEAASLNKALAVDHCHTTNTIRGLLCTHCNVGIGHFRDSPEKLKSAIAYLTR